MEDNTKLQEETVTPEQLEFLENFIKDYSDSEKLKQFSDLALLDMKDIDSATREAMRTSGYSPNMSQQILDNFYPTAIKTSNEILNLLNDPRQNANALRAVSRNLEASILSYHRIVKSLSDIKSYKYYLTCDSPVTREDVSPDEYKESRKLVHEILRSLNIPYQSRLMDRATISDGVSFWLFYESLDGTRLLPVPPEYAWVTAPSISYGYTWALDLTFVDSLMYLYSSLPELNYAYKKFCDIRKEGIGGTYKGKKITSDYVKSVQYYPISQKEGCCVFFDEHTASRVPVTAGVMAPAADLSAYRSLLKKKSTADLYTLVLHRIERDKQTNKLVTTFQEAQQIISAIQSVSPDNIRHAATIFEGEEPIKFTTTDVLQTLNSVGSTQFYQAAAMQPAFFSDSIKSAKGLEYSSKTTFAFASEGMYEYIGNIFNSLIAKKNNSKYRWSIRFFGNTFDEKEDIEIALKFANIIGNPYMLFAVMGFEPFQVEGLLLDDLSDIKKNMLPFKTSSTNAGDGGRPETGNSQEGDSDASDE